MPETENSAFLEAERPIHWSKLTADALPGDIEEAIRLAEAGLAEIEAIPLDECSYENVVSGMDRALRTLSDAWSLASHLSSVQNTPDYRKAYNAALPSVSRFFAGLCLRGDLWLRIRKVSDDADAVSDPTAKRHLAETRRDFEEAGALLDEEKKEELRKVESRLAEVTQKFTENVLDSTEAWELVITDRSQLDGLPESALRAAREDARTHGHGSDDQPAWRFSLQAPSYLPVLQHAHSEDLRRRIWEAATRIGIGDEHHNPPLIREILELRNRKTELLGFTAFSDLTTNRRMVKNGASALRFVGDLHERVSPAFRHEVAQLEEFRAEQVGDEVRHLEPWEVAYWSERMRRSLYDYDEEELRQWFPIRSVQNGLFSLAEKVFAVQIRQKENPDPAWLWHPHVEFYDLFDSGGALLGSFYADWYPRKGKRDGAWMNPLFSGAPRDEKNPQPHYGVICGNLTPPSGEHPALLTHREVETIFHEFGHLLHHLCSTVSIRDLSGTNVAWDFVELPSQIMENWCWERESLDLFARHHQTGEPIPEALFQKMRKARNFQSAVQTMRQLSFAKIDLELHANREFEGDEALFTFVDAVLSEYQVPLRTKPPSILPRFTHLFGSPTGYAAGYYSYKYAEMLDADAFSRFQNEGILNAETGKSFRDHILAKGNSEPPETLFRNFMGRDPNPEALLQRAGLTDESNGVDREK